MKNFTKFVCLVVTMCMLTKGVFAFPKLNSLPAATATIYLDFDGHYVNCAYWNGGMPIACASSTLTSTQVTEIFNRVAEDYRPFNVNITTDSTKFLAAPLTQRIRVIVTPTSAWKPNVGGVAYIGSFTWGDDTPAFVFTDRLGPNNSKFIAECLSHESGHTVGLSHQSRYDNTCNLTETYHTGLGSGETSWAPIMGNSYGKNMTGWNDGPTPYGCANTQDNLSIITSTNGFGYRTDDYQDQMNSSAFTPNSTSFSINGIITTSTDKDIFRFNISTLSNIHIDALPYGVGANNIGADLDVKILMYDEAQVLVKTFDPTNTMGVTIDTTLKPGIYYFVLDGTGNVNASNYGSLGSYSFSGFRSALPIHDVSLSGTVSKNKHQLSWNIISDEPVRSVEVEVSNDGSNFNAVNTVGATSRNFSYTTFDNAIKYYRVKATSVIDQVVYSNVIALRSNEKETQAFTISTFVTQQLSVQAAENFQYKLLDLNGRTLAVGRGNKGYNIIDMSNKVSGSYVIQLFGITQKQSERFIKQ
jgi:hypothetical protein